MKPSYSLIVGTIFGLGITAGLCWCANLVTTYEFFEPHILMLVIGCIFLLLADVWILLVLEWSDALGKHPLTLKKALQRAAKPAADKKAVSSSKAADRSLSEHTVKEKPVLSVQEASPATPAKPAAQKEESAEAAKPISSSAADPAPQAMPCAQPAEEKAPAVPDAAAAKKPEEAAPEISTVPTRPAAPLSAPVQDTGFTPVPPRRHSSSPAHIEWGSAEQTQEMMRARQEELDRKRLAENQALEAAREKQLAQSEQVQQRRRQAREADAAKWNTHSL